MKYLVLYPNSNDCIMIECSPRAHEVLNSIPVMPNHILEIGLNYFSANHDIRLRARLFCTIRVMCLRRVMSSCGLLPCISKIFIITCSHLYMHVKFATRRNTHFHSQPMRLMFNNNFIALGKVGC